LSRITAADALQLATDGPT